MYLVPRNLCLMRLDFFVGILVLEGLEETGSRGPGDGEGFVSLLEIDSKGIDAFPTRRVYLR